MAEIPFNMLWGSDRDVAAAVTHLFQSYGIGSLAPKIMEFARSGYSADTMTILLQDTPEYKQRFAANEARRKKGLPVLSAQEYLQTEKSYRQIMSASGLPPGFYDSQDDFKTFLENDVAPQEIQARVESAQDFVNNADPLAKAAMLNWYTAGDLIAYALDPARATTLIEKQLKASRVGGAAWQQGLHITKETGEDLQGLGLSDQAVSQAFSVVAQEMPNAKKLAAIDETQITQEELIGEAFKNNAQAAEKRARLASSERARFGGSAGVGSEGLSRTKGGNF